MIHISPALGKRRFSHKQNGAALVEYAFSITLFLAFVFGINGFGHALYAYHFVNNAAKEATRWAAVNGHSCGSLGDNSCNGTAPMNNGPASSSDVDTYVKAHVPTGIDSARITTSGCGLSDTAACADSTPDACIVGKATFVAVNNPGCIVQVRVGYAYRFIFPFLPTTTAITAPCTVAGLCLSSTSEFIIAH
jgi:Flp pilus assembly protein TadG